LRRFAAAIRRSRVTLRKRRTKSMNFR
jgi:hypothetical protein